jgi:hypothetical protein
MCLSKEIIFYDEYTSMVVCYLLSGQIDMSVESVQEELDSMAEEYPDRFKIYYVLNQVHPMFFSGLS